MALGNYVHKKFARAKRRSIAPDALPVPVLSPRFVQAAGVRDDGRDDMQPHNEHDFPPFLTAPFNPVDPLQTSKVHPSIPHAVTNDVTASVHSSTFATGSPATTSSLRKSVPGHVPTSSTASTKFVTSSASPAPSNSSSGAIAGGVVVGLIGFAMLVCVVVYLMRRSQRHRDQFDANEFRRSAVLMPDLPTHEDVINRGFHPRSPYMAERKSPPLLVQTYHGDDSSVPDSKRDDNATNPIATPVPPSPSSHATAGHSQPGDQTSAPSLFVARQQCRPPSSRRASRPASGNDPGAANGFIFPRRRPPPLNISISQTTEPKLVIEQVPPDDYVDLSRSSVSPFQVVQHGEIAIGHHDNEIATSSPTGTVGDLTSPPKSPLEDSQFQHENSIRQSINSGQSLTRSQTPELLDFPVPPSPAPTVASRYRISMPPVSPESMVYSRIDSVPPVLPELDLGSRNSQLYERPLSNSFVKRRSLAAKHRSSPLASSGILASPQVPAISEPAIPKRPETVYDPKDAYGGIQTA